MILYFSATGNGKYISEQIAKKTDETPPCCYPVAEPVAGENPETIGFSPL